MWSLFNRKTEKSEEPPKRRPFLYDDSKTEEIISVYREADSLLFERRTDISKKKKYY